MWTPRAQQVVSQLIARASIEQRGRTSHHSIRLGALHIGGSLWADYYLRPNGEVVVVDEDEQRPEVTYTDRSNLSRAIVWGSERYPELRELIPARPPWGIDCRCRQSPIFTEGRALCSECGALGWLEPPNIEAAWIPGWYELDQSIEVGSEDEFAFWKEIPDELRGPESIVFYNTLWRTADAIIARGVITSIRHSQLGSIRKLSTEGLEYAVVLDDGTELKIEAEEDPGKLYGKIDGRWCQSKIIILDWRMTVTFESLSQPKPGESWSNVQ